MGYNNLNYFIQGFATNVFIDTVTNELKVYRIAPPEHSNIHKLNSEGKLLLWKIYKLYGKIPRDFEKLPNMSQKEFNDVYTRGRDHIEQTVEDYAEIRGIKNGYYGSRNLYEHVIREIPKLFNDDIGSGLPHDIMNDIDRSIDKALVYGNHILKKAYKRHKRLIKTKGVEH